jgi:hypothetical protein
MSSGRVKVEDVTTVRYKVAAETATAPWPLTALATRSSLEPDPDLVLLGVGH